MYSFAPYLQRVLDVRFTGKKYPNSIALSVARIGGVGILRGELQLPVYFSQKVPRLLRVLVHIVSVVFLRD